MGFGTLFIGYFLLLNITYFTVTDVICGLVMAIGLQKLSPVNRYFKGAFYVSLLFSALGLYELVLTGCDMFMKGFSADGLLSYCAIPRYVILALLSLLILDGIRDVSKEVGLGELSKKSYRQIFLSLSVYFLLTLLEFPGLEVIIDTRVLAIISIIMLLSLTVTIILNLVTIYSAYMRICMPGEKDITEKPSKFAFINKYREHNEQKQREYAEYRMEKIKKKNSRNKK